MREYRPCRVEPTLAVADDRDRGGARRGEGPDGVGDGLGRHPDISQ